MRLFAGTSGFAFKEWKGTFYPSDLKDDGMLSFYAGKFPTVEINNTFYRLPRENVMRDWASQVPESFTFAIKASQRITHYARLKPEAAGPLEFLLKNTELLGDKLGPILFQLPPNLKKDIERLRGFLPLLPDGRRFAMEFRHESWFDEETYDELRARGVALCSIEQPDFMAPLISTATWGYVRLHRFDYDAAMLKEWARKVRAEEWTDVFVYLKHDEDPAGRSGPPAVETFVREFG